MLDESPLATWLSGILVSSYLEGCRDLCLSEISARRSTGPVDDRAVDGESGHVAACKFKLLATCCLQPPQRLDRIAPLNGLFRNADFSVTWRSSGCIPVSPPVSAEPIGRTIPKAPFIVISSERASTSRRSYIDLYHPLRSSLVGANGRLSARTAQGSRAAKRINQRRAEAPDGILTLDAPLALRFCFCLAQGLSRGSVPTHR